jgi:hypothetical protein
MAIKYDVNGDPIIDQSVEEIPQEPVIQDTSPYEPSPGEMINEPAYPTQPVPLLTNILSDARAAKKAGQSLLYIPGSGVYNSAEERGRMIGDAQKEFGAGNVEDMGDVQKKPSDGELDVSEQIDDYKKHLIKEQFGGRNPFTHDYRVEVMSDKMKYMSNSDWLNMPEKNRIALQKEVDKEARTLQTHEQDQLRQRLQYADQQIQIKQRQKETEAGKQARFEETKRIQEENRKRQELKAEQDKQAILDRRGVFNPKQLNDELYKMTEGGQKTLAQSDYDTIKQMAYPSGYDVDLEKGNNGQWIPKLTKKEFGYQPDGTYFDKKGPRYKEGDKWYYGKPDKTKSSNGNKTIVKTGKDKSGRKVVKYSDGTIEYAQ